MQISHRQSKHGEGEAPPPLHIEAPPSTLSCAVHWGFLFSGPTLGTVTPSVGLSLLLPELCFAAGTGEDRGDCGMLQLGKGKLENEKGSGARAAAKLFKAIFSTGLIIPPHGVRTPSRSEVCISLLQGAAY